MRRTALDLRIAIAAAAIAAAASGCSTDDGKVAADFRITDAPVASDSVEAVYVTFAGLQINSGDGDADWRDVPIDSAKEYELLSLTDGLSAALGSIDLEGGTKVNQIRFAIDKIELTETADAPGDARHPVALASSTGLKIVNAFDVPLTGTITFVVDFDVRKSLVKTGGAQPSYKMKPTLRAVVEGEAGRIRGAAPLGHLVFAYRSQAGADIDLAFADPADDADSAAFDDAYTSASVKDDGTYVLAFLEPGDYDLVLADPADGAVKQVANDVSVVAGEAAPRDLAIPLP